MSCEAPLSEIPGERRSFAKISLGIFAGVMLLPFVYLTSLALLLSAYVHGWSIPSRSFLRAYAVPSNMMAGAPAVGRIYTRYFEFWVKVTKADYDPNKEQ